MTLRFVVCLFSATAVMRILEGVCTGDVSGKLFGIYPDFTESNGCTTLLPKKTRVSSLIFRLKTRLP